MTRRNDLIVGSVVLLGATLILCATLWLKQADVGQRHASVEARFRDAGGVQVGNQVLIRGVRAGRVERIELGEGGWVTMRLELDPAVRLPEEPVVVLNAASLFGEWQAEIVSRSSIPHDEGLERQLDDAAGSSALAGATLPDIAHLTAVTARIAGDVASVADRVHLAFNDSAARELRQSIASTADLTGTLARTVRRQSRNLDSVSVDVRSAVRLMGNTASALHRTVQRIDSSTSQGEIDEVITDAGAAAELLRETAVELRGISRQLARSQSSLETFLARADSVAVKVNGGTGSLGALVNERSLYENGDSLVVALRDLVSDIRRNPKRYFTVRLF